uniref:Uncharacterized protein n=1 Tax=Leucosporidium scottii TaxID=5278 RepID=A0A0H5FSE5_9BASI|nr:hypothetical protein [Leucosporidium scottii]
MCWSHATLFYGLWVTTASLNFAATAHKATRPTSLAIDLIISGRRRGQLEIEGQDEKTTARELPEEVWDLVKDQLLGIEVREVELDVLDGFRYEDCRLRGNSCDCHNCEFKRRLEGQVKPRWTSWGYPNCITGVCVEAAADSGFLHARTSEQIKDIRALLAYHGLQMPSTEMWYEDPECFGSDFNSLSAISLPLRSNSVNRFPSARSDCKHGHGAASAVLNFSPNSLLVPADAHHRFRRLVSSYRLQARDRTQDLALSPNDPQLSLSDPIPPSTNIERDKADDKSAIKKEAEVKEAPKLFAEAEPRWMLWSLCEPCD